MNTTLQTINSLHNLNIKKEDFNSFRNIKQYFDKFIKIILMDSPTFVATLESAEKYLNEDGNYPYLKSFYETFRLSDDGYDSIDAIVLARYCNLLQYVLEKIDPHPKMKFNIMDIFEPKFTRLVSFLSKLSVFADFINVIGDDVKKVIWKCEIEKRKNDKVISDIKLREQQLLQNNYNYEELNDYFHALNAKFKCYQREFNKNNEMLKEKISNTINMNAQNNQMKIVLNELKEKTLKITAEKNALQKRIAKDPEQLDEELFQLQSECNKESEKLHFLFHSNANLKHSLKQSEIVSSTISLYSNHLSFLNEAIENYENFAHEKLKMQRPEIEINSHLLKKNENLKREINVNREKYFSQIDDINREKMENMRALEHIKDLEEQLKILKINKQEKLDEKIKYEKEMKHLNDNFQIFEQKYNEKKQSIEENFNESLKELGKHYKSPDN